MRIIDVRTGQDVIRESSITRFRTLQMELDCDLDSGYRIFLSREDVIALICEFKRNGIGDLLLSRKQEKEAK